VRFKVKSRNGKIAKVKLEKSSGFKSFDDEAVMALWNLEYWKGGRMVKDAEYIVPVRFDANLEE
jgi:TonB family protein